MPGLIEFGEPIELSLPMAGLPPNPLQNARFRVYVLSEAHQKMLQHLKQRLDVESGGILVGYPFQSPDNQVKFVVIVGIVPNQSNNRSGVHFTVSPEEARDARELVEDHYPGMIPVGWYHSHPGLSVFLSGQDMTIVRSIYNAEWNIAWVVDPIRGTEGIFYGSNGTPLVENHRELPLSRPSWISLDNEPECILKIKAEAQKTNVVGLTTIHSDKYERTDRSITSPAKNTKPLKPVYAAPSNYSESRRREENDKNKKMAVAITIFVIIAVLGIAVFIISSNQSWIIQPTATPSAKSFPVYQSSKVPVQTTAPNETLYSTLIPIETWMPIETIIAQVTETPGTLSTLELKVTPFPSQKTPTLFP